MIRVAIVDDHPVVREGLASLLDDEPDFAIVASVGSAEELLAHLESTRPEVVLIDLQLPAMGGIEAVARLATAAPQARAIIFSAFEADDDVRGAVVAGARGYVLKGSAATEVAHAIREVAAGGLHVSARVAERAIFGSREGAAGALALTSREREVLRLVGEGLSNKQIAARLGIAERTAKFHLSSIMAKLGAENRAQAVALAAQRKIV